MKKRIDHKRVITISEWGSTFIEGLVLGKDDQRLAKSLSEDGEGRCVIDELRTGLRVSARSWVGLILFSNFEIQIVPKLAGDNLGLVELIDYATGLDSLARHPAVRDFESSGTSLFDLLALLFVEGCEQVIRSGLLSDYCEVEEDLPVLRGRLLMREQVLKRFGMIDRLKCRYDEYLTDIPENRILLAGLYACSGRVRHPSVAMRVRRLLGIFSEICTLESTNWQQVRASLLYNRLNEHYREPHGLAWLILEGLGIEDIYLAGKQRCFAFLLDMNKLFEDFISRWLKELLISSTFRILPQRRDRTILWNATLGKPYSAVIPDLLIEHRGPPSRLLPVDAKYKLYDERRISPADIYQTLLYAFAYGELHSILPSVLLLYPASSISGGQVRLHIRRSSGIATAQLRAMPIHIPTALVEARTRKNGPVSATVFDQVREAFGLPTATICASVSSVMASIS